MVDARRATVAIDAGLEGEKAIDGAKLQSCICRDDETAGGVDRKPRREHVAAPDVQECGDQQQLLGQAQQHLDQIRRPAANEPVKAAAALFAFGAARPPWRVNLRVRQAASFPVKTRPDPSRVLAMGLRRSTGLHPITR